jgi:hypothetical protein
VGCERVGRQTSGTGSFWRRWDFNKHNQPSRRDACCSCSSDCIIKTSTKRIMTVHHVTVLSKIGIKAAVQMYSEYSSYNYGAASSFSSGSWGKFIQSANIMLVASVPVKPPNGSMMWPWLLVLLLLSAETLVGIATAALLACVVVAGAGFCPIMACNGTTFGY